MVAMQLLEALLELFLLPISSGLNLAPNCNRAPLRLVGANMNSMNFFLTQLSL